MLCPTCGYMEKDVHGEDNPQGEFYKLQMPFVRSVRMDKLGLMAPETTKFTVLYCCPQCECIFSNIKMRS